MSYHYLGVKAHSGAQECHVDGLRWAKSGISCGAEEAMVQ